MVRKSKDKSAGQDNVQDTVQSHFGTGTNGSVQSVDEMVKISLQALSSIAEDTLAPAAARASAARSILEYAGALGKHQKPPTGEGQALLSEMSRDALMEELAKLRRDTQG